MMWPERIFLQKEVDERIRKIEVRLKIGGNYLAYFRNIF